MLFGTRFAHKKDKSSVLRYRSVLRNISAWDTQRQTS